jgi:hypothetical protein
MKDQMREEAKQTNAPSRLSLQPFNPDNRTILKRSPIRRVKRSTGPEATVSALFKIRTWVRKDATSKHVWTDLTPAKGSTTWIRCLFRLCSGLSECNERNQSTYTSVPWNGRDVWVGPSGALGFYTTVLKRVCWVARVDLVDGVLISKVREEESRCASPDGICSEVLCQVLL